MKQDPSTNIFGGLVAEFLVIFYLYVFQHCCKIRIVEAQSGAPGNRTPLIKGFPYPHSFSKNKIQ